MTITIEQQGKRFYLRGNTYPIKDQLRAAGAKWDPDAKCWWTGKRETAEAIVSGAAPDKSNTTQPILEGHAVSERPRETLANDTKIAGRAKYRGRDYILVWEGETGRGHSAKLAFADGSSVFWTQYDQIEVTKRYQPRVYRGQEQPMTFGRLNRLREDFSEQRKAEREAEQIVGERGPYSSRFEASKHNRTPGRELGSTSWLRHAGKRIAVVLVGYQSATYIRGEDAEDMGEYDLRSGWYGMAYHRAAMKAEYDALQARVPRPDGVCVADTDMTESATECKLCHRNDGQHEPPC